MASPFIPSSNLSSFYAGSMAPPIKLPDGTYIPAPNTMSVEDMYRGIYPPSAPPAGVSRVTNEGLNVYARPTVAIGSDGSPVFPMASPPNPPQFQAGMLGRISPPSGPVPSQDRMVAEPQGGPKRQPYLDPSGTYTRSLDPFFGYSDRLAGGGGGPAVSAIDDLLAGSGRSTAFPFPRLPSRYPVLPPTGPQPIIEKRDQAWVEQGPDMEALKAVTEAADRRYGRVVRPGMMGRNPGGGMYGPSPPSLPAPNIPGAITFKKGDTVGKLAKSLGMTVSSFADRYGISNPNKIYAGQTVVPQAGPMPRMPPAGLMRSARSAPIPRLPPQALNRARQIAEGKASQLDEFGMIR